MVNFFRISDWKQMQFQLVLTMALLWALFYNSAFSSFVHPFFYLLVTALLVGCTAYYINDVFDIEKDRIAGKYNFASKHSRLQQLAILTVLVISTFTLWYFHNGKTIILQLLIAEFIALFLYSNPITRLKEKPFLSILLDALYAFVIPGAIVILTLISATEWTYHHTIFIVWLLFVGIRGILNHHVIDYENDLLSSTQTTATRYGKDKILLINKVLIASLELILFTCLTYQIHWIVCSIFLMHATFQIVKHRYQLFHHSYLKPAVGLNRLILNKFYSERLQFILLVLLCIQDLNYLYLVPIFMIIAWNSVLELSQSIYRIGSLTVNYSLYYGALIFGVNLKERAAKKLALIQNNSEKNPTDHPTSLVKEAPEILEKNVHGMWIGTQLSNMELLTIHSFIVNGYTFHLWLYDQLETPLPNEVILHDAATIIPKDKIFRYKNSSQFGHGKGSVAGFSDIFRYKLLYEHGGWWVDMDVTSLVPFDVKSSYFFRTHNSLKVVGNIMKVPAKSTLMLNCYNEAIASVDENNSDWHKPIEILERNIVDLGLDKFIYDGYCNLDNFEELEQFYYYGNSFPEKWKFVHWTNEAIRNYGLQKDYSFYNSTYQQLLFHYGISYDIADIEAHDKKVRNEVLVANLKMIL